MYFPAQTSLMPVNVALARFLENEGFGSILGNYPFWYLGSTPFRYLSGPIVPLVLTLAHRLLPNFSLFEIFFFLLALAWIVGSLGVYLLIKELGGGQKREGLAAAVFYFFGPIVPFLFRFTDGLYLVAFSTLPFILLFYFRFLQKQTRKSAIVLTLLISFSLLIDTLILPALLLGMAAIFLAYGKWQRAEEKIKRSLWLMAYCLLLATLWYTPSYWLTLLGSPSFGGKGLGQVIVWVGKLLPVALALTLAVFSVRFFKKREFLRDFCFFWLFIFGFLTLIRFFSDPDFWLDWTAYGVELQLGLAILGGLIARWLLNRKQIAVSIASLTFYLLLFFFIFNKYLIGTLQKDIATTVEYKIGSQLSQLIKPGERPVKSPNDDHGASVFLSGTTTFWLNAFFDIHQVRGGRDQVSVDPRWREAVWEIREGTDPEKSIKWLKDLQVDYLAVHTADSEEFYHDFVYPGKFETAKDLKKVFAENGDIIYRVEPERRDL